MQMFIGISSCLEFTAGASTISKIVIILVSRYHFRFDPQLGLAMLICLLVYPIALVYRWCFYTRCNIFITAINIFFVMISLYCNVLICLLVYPIALRLSLVLLYTLYYFYHF